LGVDEKKDFLGGVLPYNYKIDTYQPFYKKIRFFVKYVLFLRRCIKINGYDRLIVLTTQSAVPIYDILRRKYREKYIFDFRDLTKENSSQVYKKVVQRIIDDSFCTMMSSIGFVKKINPHRMEKIQIVHNTQLAQKSMVTTKIEKNTAKIRIGFWGIIRQIEHNKKFCDRFGADPRFELFFHGTGEYEKLQEYCKMKKYNNVFFTGTYNQTEIPKFANQTDVLHCIYENDIEQQPAMPVKAYDAIKYRLPVLISKNSQVANFFKGTSGALAVNLGDNRIADKVYNWFHNLKTTQVENDFKRLENKVLMDDLLFNEKVEMFIGAENNENSDLY